MATPVSNSGLDYIVEITGPPGITRTIKTHTPQADWAPVANFKGPYRVRVRTVDRHGNKSGWVDVGTVEDDKELDELLVSEYGSPWPVDDSN